MEMDWHRILFSDHPYSFFIEILIRTPIVFLALVITLRLTGKRGVQQLSIFEMVMIIALGSAAGDSMFYKEVGVLHAFAVFIIVLVVYRMIIMLISKSEKAETVLEGKAICILKEGEMCLKEESSDQLGADEFFGQLRIQHIEHLGQLRYVILEDTGSLSVYFYADPDVKPGLPILPDLYGEKRKEILAAGLYACSRCGKTVNQQPIAYILCENCQNDEWVLTINSKRIT